MPRLDHKAVPGIETLYSLNLGELPEQPKRDCPEPNQAIRRKMLQTAFEHYGSEWMGGLQSWKEAAALLANGWPEGAERLRVLAQKLSSQVPQARSIRRKLTWADDGDEICKDRLQSGLLDQCWRTMRRSPFVAPQTVAIETTWGGHYGQTAEELFWQGAAAAVMTDILEEAGYRVEVYANRVSERRGRRHCVRVKVKEADMPMRLDGVAAVLCHAGIFRTFGFLCIEQAEFDVGDWGHGHGSELNPGDAGVLNGGVESIHIGTISTESEAVAAIRKFVEKGDQGNGNSQGR
jgi:hypothetical protein